jgi:hypothetical protein
MKRASMILLAGLLAAAGAYFGTYYAGTANSHALQAGPAPELQWLKEEFGLDDAEFARISKLHEAYLSGCAERCQLIDEKNRHLKELLTATNTITPEIEKTLAEAAQLRTECQKQMLAQFYAVGQTMPPEQARRYLAWVQERTVLSDAHRAMHPAPQPAMESHHHH